MNLTPTLKNLETAGIIGVPVSAHNILAESGFAGAFTAPGALLLGIIEVLLMALPLQFFPSRP